MKTKSTHRGLLKKAFNVMLPAFLLSAMSVSAQISENFGTGTSSTFAGYTGYNNFATTLTFSGSGEVRTTSPSTGYTPTCAAAASGGSNAFLNPGKNFIIGNINTNSCGGSPFTFTFGVFKSTTTENGSHIVVEYSTDGGSTWNPTSAISLPTGTGTSHWYLRSVTGLPVNCNVQIRFTNTAVGAAPFFRIDDLCLSCGSPAVLSCSASIDTSGVIELCQGGSITLTASAGTAWLWNDMQNTQSITVSASGTYWVTVTNGCCFAVSDTVRIIVHHELAGFNSTVEAFASVDTICASSTPTPITLTARTVASDLFISQYQEGGGFDKAIEIYNGTGRNIDLTHYHISEYMNGNCAAMYTLNFPVLTMINAGQTYVIANPSHSGIGSTLCYDATWMQLEFNGNDAIELYNDTAAHSADIFGSICHNPGSAWTAPAHYSTKDRTLYRKPCIFEGISVNPNLAGHGGFSTLGTEWLVDTLATDSGFCSHDFGATSYNWSAGTTPSTGDTVIVSPTVTTTYTVTGVYCDGCTYTDTVRIFVDPGCRLAAPHSNDAVSDIKADAYPNPFTGNTTLNVTTSEDGLVKVEILNMLGATVAVLNNNELPAGVHTFTWNGSATNGAILADGVYSCKVTTGNSVKTVMLVKSSK